MHGLTRQSTFVSLALALALATGILVGCGGDGASTDAPPATQQPTEAAAPTPTQQPTDEPATAPPATEQSTDEAAAPKPTQQPTEEVAPTSSPTEEAATPKPTQQPAEEAAPTSPPTQSQPEVGHETGDLAPGFTVATADGGQLSLDSLQGRPVLLYFFTTW